MPHHRESRYAEHSPPDFTKARAEPRALTDPPPGWTVGVNQLVPVTTVDGYLLRRDVDLVGLCKLDGCWRRAKVNFLELKERGLGSIEMALVEKLHRCHRIEGCGFSILATRPRIQIQLQALMGRPFVRIRMTCGHCKFFSLIKPATLAERLADRGGGEILVCDLPSHSTSCSRCGRRGWDVAVLWHNTNTIGWKDRAEKIFDDMKPPPLPEGSN